MRWPERVLNDFCYNTILNVEPQFRTTRYEYIKEMVVWYCSRADRAEELNCIEHAKNCRIMAGILENSL